jgi:hypothetical protein
LFGKVNKNCGYDDTWCSEILSRPNVFVHDSNPYYAVCVCPLLWVMPPFDAFYEVPFLKLIDRIL